MRNIRSFIIIGISIALSFIVFFATNWVTTQIKEAFDGDAAKFLSAGFGIFGLYVMAALIATFLIAQILGAIFNIFKASSKLIALVALACTIILPISAALIGYNNIKNEMNAGVNKTIDNQLEKTYGSEYKAKVSKEVDKQISKLTDQQKKDFEAKTGVKVSEADQLIEKGEYTKLLNILQGSSIDITSEMEKRGIDPDSPIGKMLLNGK